MYKQETAVPVHAGAAVSCVQSNQLQPTTIERIGQLVGLLQDKHQQRHRPCGHASMTSTGLIRFPHNSHIAINQWNR